MLYEYDKTDNITKLTDRDGRETVYEYDPLNRLTKVVRPDGSQSECTYDARNQVLEAKNTCVCGFLISDYQYTYNDAGLITKEVAKEDLFTSNKDYGHNGGEKSAPMRTEAVGEATTRGGTAGTARTHGRTRTRNGKPQSVRSLMTITAR